MNTKENFEELENPDGGTISGDISQEENNTYLRDLTEDDVYTRLQRVQEFPDHINGLESRFNGNFTQLQERLAGLEKVLGSRTVFDGSKLQKVLQDYDPKLAEILIPALTEAINVSPLDENTLRPHLDPISARLTETFGQQLVLSQYPPEILEEIIPPIKGGKFVPEGERHKNFIEWYSQQGYQTQQSLLTFGAPYVNALRKFEAWEQSKKQDKAKSASSKTNRLAQGQIPTSQTRRTGAAATPQDAFLAAFEEIASESK